MAPKRSKYLILKVVKVVLSLSYQGGALPTEPHQHRYLLKISNLMLLFFMPLDYIYIIFFCQEHLLKQLNIFIFLQHLFLLNFRLIFAMINT